MERSEHIYKKVINHIQEYGMLTCNTEGGKLAVMAAVSGGGDSMAMLDMLHRMQESEDFKLTVVHVNHGIRGEEALRDQCLVEKCCQNWEIPCSVYAYDVPQLSREWKLGLEETGRIVRRQALNSERQKWEEKGCQVKVAFAHNQNDLAETVLHHLARGSALRGLSGIKAVDDFVIRPVLCLKRTEIDDYLKNREIPYVLDSTNLEDEYTRNRIRHHVLPVLEQDVNEQAVSHIAEAASVIAEADNFLQKQGHKLFDTCKCSEGKAVLPAAFFQEEQILQKYAVMEVLQFLSGKQKDLSSIHVQQVLDLYKSQNGRKISLPYGMTARKDYEGIVLEKGKDAAGSADIDCEDAVEFQVPGFTKCAHGCIKTKIFAYNGQKICEKKYTKWLDYDTIKRNLSLRTRKTGDYMVINQAGNRKKLTRCMIDEKIPQENRERMFLVACESEILWMIGGRLSEKYKITPETRSVLEIKYQGGNRDE